jgi:archaetidylinositol phosphate synthase
VLSKLKNKTDRIFHRPAMVLTSIGITPSIVSTVGFLIGVLAGIALSFGSFVIGGILILLTGLADILDGVMARSAKMTSISGSVMDSIFDRYVDSIILLGLGLGGVNWLYVGLALMGSLLVSYVRAKAESVGVEGCDVGIAERSERLIILAAGALLGLAAPAVIIVAVLANLTAVWRVIYVAKRV